MSVTYGERIRKLREQRGLTQREVIKLMGLSPYQNALLSRWENDIVPPRKRNLLKLSKALHVDPCEIFPEVFRDCGMTLNEYQRLARRTMNPALSHEETSRHALHGMCAEVGEIHSLYQKFYQGHEMDAEHVKKEVGDLLWMVAEFCTVNGWKMSDVAQMNIDKLKARYPAGFAAENSLHRAEGDV